MAGELRFDGKVVVITGSGAGLGKSHALWFGKRGAKVVVNDLGGSSTGGGKSSAAADKVVEEIKAAGGTAVANYDSVEDGDKIIKTAIDSFGRIDVLINNAGILRDVSFQKMSKDDWDLIFRVHVNGAFRCTHAAWPYMRDQGYGRILFTTSAAGIYGNFGQANYSAAKLALVGFSNTLAIEGEKKNIRCNAVAPVAASRLTETILPPDVLENLKPEFVTPLVGWLAHEECTENGGLFEVGGGYFGKLRWERTEGKTFKLGREIPAEAVRGAWDDVVNWKKATHPANITEALGPVLSNLSTKSKGGNEFIDVDQALGYELPELETSYDERDLALYALGVGAGKNPTDSKDLHLVYERNGDGFYGLPTYGVVPALNAIFKMASEGQTAPGLNYGLDRILHGEQYLEVTRPLPAHAKLKHKARISEILDKGKHAVVVTHLDSYDAETGELLVKNDVSMVVRGAGGWGGDRGAANDVNVAPERAADVVITEKTDAAQALLYRLSGDWNPLHVDPEFATMFGFEKPILHGLCTFGYVGRAAINAFAKGDPRTFKSIKVRFADSVFPGETLKIELWKENDLRVLIRATAVERNKVVISNAAVEFYPEIPKPKAKELAAPKTAPAAPVAAQFNSAQSFEAIGAYVAKTPDLAKQINTIYQFKLSSPDSAWVLDLKAGAVRAGTVEKADCTLALSDADWLDMVTGKADPMKLFQGGKLKITGNVMASQKLDFLKKIDRAAVVSATPTAAAVPAASSAPASAEVLAPKIFKALQERLAKNPGLAKEVDAVIAFKVKDAGFEFTAELKGASPTVKSGADAKAGTRIILTDEALGALAKGENAQKLFQHGQLRVEGELLAAHRLGFLKQLV
jgi:(3R)-3-hydroxyacyl-CoA dehydrogenase / 3a,7a,12a-trihydroxy-5b-cholest-24-enoyl-CoA hydratase / enoyl-CoA hydratase 2